MRIRPDQDRTRLEAVKDAMIEFAKRRQTDRLGVVVFSEQGYVAAPLTNDLPYVLHYIRMIDTATLASEGTTAIGEGVWTAMVHARSQSPASAGGKGKVIILLTDGQNTAGRDPVEAIRVAGAAGFRVHFIGVELEQAEHSQSIIESVARTGGKYYDVDKETELQQAYADIDRQEKARFITNTEVRNVPNYAPFVIAAFVLLLCAQLLRTLRYFTEVS
jgi:Ca-activated chloride channel family protein